MTSMNYEDFDAISSEYIAAHAELERVLKARDIVDGEIPVISRDDDEAVTAIQRMQVAQARMNTWLDAMVR